MGKVVGINQANAANSEPIGDADLVRKFQQTGDAHYVVAILQRYADQISGMGYRYFRDAQDIQDFTSDLYIKLVDKLPEVDVAEIRNFRTWFYVFVKHAILDAVRKRKTYQTHKSGFGVEAGSGAQVTHQPQKQLDNPRLHEILGQLSEKEQLCIQLIYFEEMSYQEIMEQYGFTFNQVRGFRDRAIARLRKLLNNEFEHYFTDG